MRDLDNVAGELKGPEASRKRGSIRKLQEKEVQFGCFKGKGFKSFEITVCEQRVVGSCAG